MFKTRIKYLYVISLIALLTGIIFNTNRSSLKSSDNLALILNGLKQLEKSVNIKNGINKLRVAVGYGACSDLYVDAIHFLRYDELEGKPKHFNEITSKYQLLKSFAYYFRHGAAAERFISNALLFDELVTKAETIHVHRWSLGGNAPVMASRFSKEGCDVLLGAMMTPKLRKSIPDGIKIAGGEASKDDIHLVLEYKNGEQWGPYKASRANRYILHNDENNPLINSLEEFDNKLTSFRPRLLVVSGIQMMDNFPFAEGVRQSRFSRIQRQMISQPKETLVHFEMASFVESELMTDLLNHVIPFTDSIGMNEQELANLYYRYLHDKVSVISNSNPRVAVSLDQMRELFRLINEHSKLHENSRVLTRIHVHTLAYQAIMTVQGSVWKNIKEASAKASLVANRHVCQTSDIDISKVVLVMDGSFQKSKRKKSETVVMDPKNPVSCWTEKIQVCSTCKHNDVNRLKIIDICVAPVLVCSEAKQTAGGGDNISAAGLVPQL